MSQLAVLPLDLDRKLLIIRKNPTEVFRWNKIDKEWQMWKTPFTRTTSGYLHYKHPAELPQKAFKKLEIQLPSSGTMKIYIFLFRRSSFASFGGGSAARRRAR
jgi:hypothetical protein